MGRHVNRGRGAELAAAAAGVLALAGCPAVVPATDGVMFSCRDQNDCHEGYRCQGGVCRLAELTAIDAGSILDATTRDLAMADLGVEDAMLDGAAGDHQGADTSPSDSGLDTSTGGDVGGGDAAAADAAADAASDAAAADTAAPDAGGCPPDWWDCRFGARLRLTFDNSQQATDLDQFPVLVHLTAGRVDMSRFRLSGADVRFVDSDGETELDYEIEEWGWPDEAWIWVKVPRIDAGSTTDHIWLYHDSRDASSAERPAAVWSAGYRAVWHLHRYSISSSAPLAAQITHIAQGFSGDDGRIAGGVRLDGQNDRLVLTADGPILGPLSDLTISAWVRLDDPGIQWGGILSARHVDEIDFGEGNFVFHTSEGSFGFENSAPFSNDFLASIPTPRGWHHVAVVVDTAAEVGLLYLDGHEVRRWADAGSDFSWSDQDQLRLGARYYGGQEQAYINGALDEVRVSAAARGAEWVRAQYLSQADAFIDYDDERWRQEGASARVRLDLQARELKETLGDFPVLVSLDLGNHLYGWGDHDGDDLRFVDPDGATLAHEIEAWTAEQRARIWVRVPQVNARSVLDHLWLYYGDPAALSVEDAAGVWDEGFIGVYHLSGNAEDSTGRAGDGVVTGARPEPGVVGGGYAFDDSGDHAVVVPDSSPLDEIEVEVSVSAWVQRRSSQSSWRLVAGREVGETNSNYYYLGFLDNRYIWHIDNGSNSSAVQPDGDAPVGSWLHMAGTYNGRHLVLFVNGVERLRNEHTITFPADGRPFIIGADSNDGGVSFDDRFAGLIDEVRLQRVARSPAWIAWEHGSARDALLTFGQEETR